MLFAESVADCGSRARAALWNTRLEVGQALLQRHEAYVRRHPRTDTDRTRLEKEVDELRLQNASLERVNTEYMLPPLNSADTTQLWIPSIATREGVGEQRSV